MAQSIYLKLLSFILLLLLINSSASAQQIITDGNTNTQLNIVGQTTDVTTTTLKNNNAFNSFSRFNVDAGNTVNLVIPAQAQRLINVVTNETTNINGILNSVQGGQAGMGNIYLVNPHGIVVGAQGQINVGALTAVTPTQAFVNGFFDSPGNPNDAAVTALINGTAPINSDAAITNAGTITGQTRIETSSGTFENTGTIQLSDIVNVDKIENGQVIGQYSGDVVIKTADALIVLGKINADGKDNVDGGNINLTTDRFIKLIDTQISAQGKGINSKGGNIAISSLIENIFINSDIKSNNINLNLLDHLILLGGDIKADNKLIFNTNGIKSFIPNTINCNVLESNFLKQNQDFILNSDVNLEIGNLANITIGGNTFNPSKIDLSTPADVSLQGNFLTSGNFIVSAQNINDFENGLNVDGYLVNFGAQNVNINASNVNFNANGMILNNLTVDARNQINLAASNINLSSSNLNAGTSNKNLLVNVDGTIDPTSNIGATITGGNVNVDNVNLTPTGKINIISNNITGNGTLKVFQGNQNVTITNNSANTLTLNSINAQSTGEILVNGNKLNNDQTIPGTTIKANYQDTGITNPQVNINNNARSNIILAGQLINNNGPVNISNEAGSILDGSPDGLPNITAQNINLTNINTGSIGLFSDPLNINLLNGTLTAQSFGYIGLEQNTGNMNVNLISNAGRAEVNLNALAGSILDASPGSTANIFSRGLTLNTTPGGSIGLMDDSLDVDTNYNTSGGNVIALSRGYIGLNEASGDLNLNVASNAGRSDVNLVAAGSIINSATNGVNQNIYARNITLNSLNGNVGSAIKPLEVYTNYNTTGGVLNATANKGLININQPVNSVTINSIIAKDNVILNGTGGLFTTTNLPTINITGNNLILGSQIQIGTVANPIVVHPSGTLSANAPKKYIIKK